MIYYINIILGTTNFYVFLMGIRKLNRKDYLLAQAGWIDRLINNSRIHDIDPEEPLLSYDVP
jgi:hypothetical protein